MAYIPQTWSDAPSTATPISAARLTVIENGLQAAAADTLTGKIVGDKLDFTSVTAPAAPAAGTTRFYARQGVSGLDAPAWVGSLGVPIVIGRDICFFAKNITGSTITKGSVVYVQSATASVVNIAKALADSSGTKLPAIGVMAADVANNSFGMVMQYGVIQAINTSGMGDGAIIYVDPTTAGAFTNTRPAHPNVGQMIGVVVNSNTSGTLLVTCAPTNTSLIQGTNNTSWGVGDGTTNNARSISFKNNNTGTLQWTPTAARTLTLPDVTGTLTAKDANGNESADAFIPGLTTTVTSATPVTLTVDSTEVQVFTGNTPQTVLLPTTGVVAGQQYQFIYPGLNVLTVQSSGANTIAQLSALVNATFVALVNTPTTAAHWAYMVAPAVGVGASVSNNTIVQRTGQGNIQANNFLPNLTSIATAAGTTTLTNASANVQLFTGITTQTLTLPTTSVAAGWGYLVINNSTGAITVNASGGTTVAIVPGGQYVAVMANQATPTTNAHWNIISGITASSTDTLINKTISGANNTLSVPSSALSDATATGKTILTVPDLLTAQSLLGVADPLLSSYMTVPRQINTSTISGLVSGTLYLTSFIADKAIAINNLKSVCVGAAGATPTLSRMAIYSVDANHTDVTLQASTANNVNAFTTGGSNTVTMPLSAAFTPTVGVQYAVGMLVVTAAALPTFSGIAFNGALAPLLPWRVARVAGLSDLPSTSAGVSIDSGAKWFALWT